MLQKQVIFIIKINAELQIYVNTFWNPADLEFAYSNKKSSWSWVTKGLNSDTKSHINPKKKLGHLRHFSVCSSLSLLRILLAVRIPIK